MMENGSDALSYDFGNEFFAAGTDTEKEKSITSKKCKVRKMYLAAICALLLSLTIGLSSGYSAPATYDMETRPNSILRPTKSETMWIGSSLALGVVTGGLLAGYLADKIGRKDTLMLNIIFSGSGWLIICYSKTVPVVLLGRFLCGLSCAFVSVVVPVYCVEISTTEVRGLLGSATQGFLVIGHLISVTVGAYISWNYLALQGAVVCIFATICFFPMPETPRWLIMKNRVSSAVRVIKSLQGDFIDAEKECERIHNDLKSQVTEKITFHELRSPKVLKPALIGIAIMFFYEFAGVNAVFQYSTDIFAGANNFMDPKKSTIVLAVIQVIVTVMSNFIIDKVGRKILLELSGSFMALSSAVFGFYYYKSSADLSFQNNYNWIPLVSLIVYVIAFSIGYGPIPHLIVPELLPLRVRSTVSSFVQVCNGLFGFVVILTFNDLENLLGDYGAYWLYTIVAVSGVLFIHFVVPETKGKRLEEIENFFRGKEVKQEINISVLS